MIEVPISKDRRRVLMAGMGGEGVQLRDGVLPPRNAAELKGDSRYYFWHPISLPHFDISSILTVSLL